MMIQTEMLRLQYDKTSVDFGNLFVTDRETGVEYREAGVLHRSAQRMLEKAEGIVREGRDRDAAISDEPDEIDEWRADDDRARAADMNAALRDIGGGL